ncbi:DUF4446 family protein [Allonocardiopsis opalescens]|uniref:Uncharacterized protein DUF4446 n=1 Tax=Allonocardiopsis opalescens TaxID=1144618 RepID=A0A2T0Q700_9ACTN|nr:DUF4446 family protein [Allonocardiopsis opalescens]PRX99616.1 uncharacterized protein DUF4446 [Allonocardiopsis opalescens]
MYLLALAAIGLLVGIAGLVVGISAHRRAARGLEESLAAINRLLPADNTVVDSRAVRDVALVRYDALKEMSGELSFSVAMLNASGDGFVLTSINGRTETRTYAKIIEGGKGVQTLSPEEYRAIRAARMGEGPGFTLRGAHAVLRARESPENLDGQDPGGGAAEDAGVRLLSKGAPADSL